MNLLFYSIIFLQYGLRISIGLIGKIINLENETIFQIKNKSLNECFIIKLFSEKQQIFGWKF